MTARKADIGFVMHHDNWISKVIAWFMGSQWSHSFIVLEDSKERTYLLETSDFEVTIGLLETYLNDPNVSLELWTSDVVSDNERVNIVNGSMRVHGQIYGYLQLLSLGIRRLLMRIGVRVPNFIRQGVVCNQVVSYGYTESNLPVLDDIDPESIDTQELYEIVLNSKSFRMAYKK